MADLRDLLQRAAPTPPEFDEAALLRMVAKRTYRRRATLAVSAIALVAAIAIAVGVTANRHSDQRTIIVSPSSTTPTTSKTSIPAVANDVEWHALPAAPIAARWGAASVWTGSAFVVWGGRAASDRELSDGAWYDPRAQVWHPMSTSPLGPAPQNEFYRGVPIAGEAVIVSGTKAATYTPGTDTWRLLPHVPLAQVDASALTQPGAPPWVILSGVDRGGQSALAWLDTANNGSWHTAAMQSRSPVVLLANGHVVYWTDNGRGVETDLATGAEHPIPKPPAALLHGYPFVPGAVAGSLVISPLAQLSWNAATRTYEALPYLSQGATSAVADGYCGGASAWTGHELLTWGGTECQGNSYLDAGAEYDPSSRLLRPLPRFLSGRTGMAFAWTGTELLIWGGQTDSNGHVVGDGASLSYAAPNPKPSVATTPGGIIGCPTQPLTPPPAGDPPPGLVDAAKRYVGWTVNTIGSVYRVGENPSGSFGYLFRFQVSSCGAPTMANAWVVEMTGDAIYNGAYIPRAQLALAHYADGWHVFGRYH